MVSKTLNNLLIEITENPFKNVIILITIVLTVSGLVTLIQVIMTLSFLFACLLTAIITILISSPLYGRLFLLPIIREYKLWERRNIIELEGNYSLYINSAGKGVITIKRKVLFLELRPDRTFYINLACKPEHSSLDLHLRSSDISVVNETRRKRGKHSIFTIQVKPIKPIKALELFDYSLTWEVPMEFGDEYDNYTSVIINKTGKYKLEVRSDIPIEHAVSFKDSGMFPRKGNKLGLRALEIEITNCPVVQLHDEHYLSLDLINPPQYSWYRTVFFYKGGKERLLAKRPKSFFRFKRAN